MAWRVLNFQPDYWAVKKFQPRMDKTKPRSVARKKLIVALARHIGVDLWRLYTAQTTPGQTGPGRPAGGGLRFESPLSGVPADP